MTTGRRSTVPTRGDVVLLPFPFAELTASKTRPAVVVSGARFFQAERKITVAAVTSNVRAHEGPTNLQLADWKASGLLKPSVITSWLATLSPELVVMKIGALGAAQMHALESRLRAALEL